MKKTIAYLCLLLCLSGLFYGCGKDENQEEPINKDVVDSVTTPDKSAVAVTPIIPPTVPNTTDAPAVVKPQEKPTSPLTSAPPKPQPQPTPAPTTPPPDQAPPKKTNTVTLSVTGADNDVILADTQVTIQEGDTVYDILARTLKENKIQFESSGIGSTKYVEGINDLYEFDKGPKSGWVYTINDGRIELGSGAVKVSASDIIKWSYVENY